MKKDIVSTQIRFPPDLYQRIKDGSAKSGRSINAEIIYRLQFKFDKCFIKPGRYEEES